MDPGSRRKPYKLKSPVTRDSFLTWDLNHQSFCRQDADFRKFLPGGTMATWKAFDEDETRGISVMKTNPNDGAFLLDDNGDHIPDDVITDRLRASLSDFLVCLGTYGPEHFMHTVVQEATSYNWVIDRIKTTFKLDTKGMGFLAGSEIKIDYGEDGQTFAQGLQATREFYCNSLQKKGTKYKGKELDKNEPLTPLGENFIVETWLNGIHPKAKAHIMQTRGHMITDDRPNLYDIQQQFCEQMDTILQEIAMGPTGLQSTGQVFPLRATQEDFLHRHPDPEHGESDHHPLGHVHLCGHLQVHLAGQQQVQGHHAHLIPASDATRPADMGLPPRTTMPVSAHIQGNPSQ